MHSEKSQYVLSFITFITGFLLAGCTDSGTSPEETSTITAPGRINISEKIAADFRDIQEVSMEAYSGLAGVSNYFYLSHQLYPTFIEQHAGTGHTNPIGNLTVTYVSVPDTQNGRPGVS